MGLTCRTCLVASRSAKLALRSCNLSERQSSFTWKGCAKMGNRFRLPRHRLNWSASARNLSLEPTSASCARASGTALRWTSRQPACNPHASSTALPYRAACARSTRQQSLLAMRRKSGLTLNARNSSVSSLRTRTSGTSFAGPVVAGKCGGRGRASARAAVRGSSTFLRQTVRCGC